MSICLLSYILNPPLTSPLFHKETIFFSCQKNDIVIFFPFSSFLISSAGYRKIFLNKMMFVFLSHLTCRTSGVCLQCNSIPLSNRLKYSSKKPQPLHHSRKFQIKFHISLCFIQKTLKISSFIFRIAGRLWVGFLVIFCCIFFVVFYCQS